MFELVFLIFIGGLGGIVLSSFLEGYEVLSGYAAMLGMIVALLGGIFYRLGFIQNK